MINKQRIKDAIGKGSIDMGLMYEYFLSKGGRKINFQTFVGLFKQYLQFSNLNSLESIYKNILKDYNVNLLKNKEGEIIMIL